MRMTPCGNLLEGLTARSLFRPEQCRFARPQYLQRHRDGRPKKPAACPEIPPFCPEGDLVVMGCYSEEHGQEALDDGADIVIGTSKRSEILSRMSRRFEGRRQEDPRCQKERPPRAYEEMGQMALADNARAYLKIQDGCDNFCSYCLIPFLRGNSRSRAKEDTLKESARLAKRAIRKSSSPAFISADMGKTSAMGATASGTF
jgi:radical SAM superfamily enzyme YgiQ (UPF0313 family)